MHKRIYAFLEKYEILYELQFVFRAGYFTTHASIHMTEAIRSALDSGSVTCGIFVDFQKAFDSVWHEGLFRKLENKGINGNFLQLIKSPERLFLSVTDENTQAIRFFEKNGFFKVGKIIWSAGKISGTVFICEHPKN